MQDVRLADDEQHRQILVTREGERAPADLDELLLVAPLGREGRAVGAMEGAGGAQLARHSVQLAAEAVGGEVAGFLEQRRAQDARRRSLGGEGALDHRRRALRHRARVAPGARRGVVDMDEGRREEHVEPVAGEAVEQLDRRARARRGAAAVALGQRLGVGTQHLDLRAEPGEEGGEERQRVDEVVHVREADAGPGERPRRRRLRCDPGPPPRIRRRDDLVEEALEQRLALAKGVGRVLGQLAAPGAGVVVLGAAAAADDLRLACRRPPRWRTRRGRGSGSGGRGSGTRGARRRSPGTGEPGRAPSLLRARRRPSRPPRRLPRRRDRPPPSRAARCRARPSLRGPAGPRPHARSPRPACAPATRWSPACPGRRRGRRSAAGPSRGACGCGSRSTAGRRRCPRA